MIWIIALVALISFGLNTAIQTECVEHKATLEDFLSLTDERAVEFSYFNPSSDGIKSYISSEYGTEVQFAVFRVHDGYVWLIGEKVEPSITSSERYRGVELKTLKDACWAYFNGITIYGTVDEVKSTIDSYYSGETLLNYLEDRGIQVANSDYLKVLKGEYCPFSTSFKVVKAKNIGDKYVFKTYSNGKWTYRSEDSFTAGMFEKHRKKIEIDVRGMDVTGIRTI